MHVSIAALSWPPMLMMCPDIARDNLVWLLKRNGNGPELPGLTELYQSDDRVPVHQYLANLDALAALPQCCLHCLTRAYDRHTTDATRKVNTNIVVTCTYSAVTDVTGNVSKTNIGHRQCDDSPAVTSSSKSMCVKAAAATKLSLA